MVLYFEARELGCCRLRHAIGVALDKFQKADRVSLSLPIEKDLIATT